MFDNQCQTIFWAVFVSSQNCLTEQPGLLKKKNFFSFIICLISGRHLRLGKDDFSHVAPIYSYFLHVHWVSKYWAEKELLLTRAHIKWLAYAVISSNLIVSFLRPHQMNTWPNCFSQNIESALVSFLGILSSNRFGLLSVRQALFIYP